MFFGDSITDCSRDRNNDDSLGDGYPLLINAKLGFDNPGKYTFINRGISGDRIVNLYARIKKDLINHAPDYVSILIGVNGVWHEISAKNGKAETITIPPYETNSPAIMVYSSGTTGASKGIQLTNTGINAAIVECRPYTYGFKRKERYFLQIPVWFSTGIITTGLAPLRYGVSLILEPIYDFELFDKEIAKYKPNYMITATGLVNHMMKNPKLSSCARYFKCLAECPVIIKSRKKRTNILILTKKEMCGLAPEIWVMLRKTAVCM